MTTDTGQIGLLDDINQARILVVDDEVANTLVLERLLARAGYGSVVAINDPRMVTESYAGFDPDLVLLDLHMPYRDGYELLAELADPSVESLRPPILVLTADTTHAALERALGSGAADFLTKPLDHAEVLLRIRNHLTSRSMALRIARQNEALERRVVQRTADLRALVDRLARTNEQRRALLGRLLAAQEEERRMIGRELHDDTIQSLTAVAYRLDLLGRTLTDDEQRSQWETIRTTVSDTMGSLRRIQLDLAPSESGPGGLSAALRARLDRLVADTGVESEYLDGLTAEPCREVAAILFRIAREAFVNVQRHAAASRVWVVLRDEEDGVRLEVRDDGRGFVDEAVEQALADGHLGITSMRERAELAGGWCRVTGTPDAGTSVVAWVPLDLDDDGSPA